MDIRQREIMELRYKVERLYQLVERITKQIVLLHPDQEDSFQESLREPGNQVDNKLKHKIERSPLRKSISPERGLRIEHKDILDDHDSNSYDYRDSNSNHHHPVLPVDVEMSYELEIQRLTAQLTAAYHRIADLEEQLLANRSQSNSERINGRS
jgi:hypothetical protein